MNTSLKSLLAGLMALSLLAPNAVANGVRPAAAGNAASSVAVSNPALPGQPVQVQDGARVRVPLNKSELLDLGRPVREVVLANPDIADVIVRTPRQLFIVGRAVGDTEAFFMDDASRVIARVPISVHVDLKAVKAAMDAVLPGENISVESHGGALFLHGTVRSDRAATDAARVARRFVAADTDLVNMLGVSGEQQVLLRVRIAEVQKTVLKNLRIDFDWQNIIEGTAVTVLTRGLLGTQALQAPEFIPFGGVNATPDIFNTNVSATLRALEQEGLLRVLAEPNVTTVSGEEGLFRSDGIITTFYSLGDNFAPYEIRVGVELAFRPVVLDRGRIKLNLSSRFGVRDPSLDTVGPGGGAIPGIRERSAQTTVELPSGGSLMIAGLIQDELRENVDGLPGLKDLPIFGALFRSTRFQRNETELVVFVTALTVESQNPNTLALPTDGFRPGNDLDVFLLGRLHRMYGDKKGSPPPDAVLGPVGYIVQ